ncbi:hypothetical protein [Shewanella glacialipiscicola]|uniref:hypothetical protein n=1 Tax=Shewanella glacialipiscicola TaxID=614069 RepID=UPI003D7A6155
MGNNRDDFTESVKRTLGDRVGWFCSFPGCNQATIGPSNASDDAKVKSGVAAHICAAAKGGPRYDPDMTSDKRKSIDNGIWMCSYHGGLIDADFTKYPVDTLKGWKIVAEENAAKRLQLRNLNQVQYSDADIRRINIFSSAFSFKYISYLKSEQFGARVPNIIIDQLYSVINLRNHPNLRFQDAHLEELRQNLYAAIDIFLNTFKQESAGGPQFYDYVDLNYIRKYTPDSLGRYIEIIRETQELADEICNVGMKFLEVQANLNSCEGELEIPIFNF